MNQRDPSSGKVSFYGNQKTPLIRFMPRQRHRMRCQAPLVSIPLFAPLFTNKLPWKLNGWQAW